MPTPPRILVVGSINIDHVIQADRMPAAGESMLGKAMSSVPGGKGANQAVAAARLGADVTFVGRVGADPWGEHVAEQLAANGINVDHLHIDNQHATGTAVILVDASGENRIIVMPGANHAVCCEDVYAALAAAGNHLEAFDGVLLQFEIPIEVTQHVIERFAGSTTPIIVDAGPARSVPFTLLRGATIISPNETEAKALTGIEVNSIDDASRAAEAIRSASGVPTAVIKLGRRGALVQSDSGNALIEGFVVDAVDTTAAGDSFTAALAVRHCMGDTLPDAVRYANAAGALAVTKFGAQHSLPTREEVEQFLAHE